MANKTLIPGVNFEGGGGGSDSADIQQQLTDAELNLLVGTVPNQIIDSFDTDSKGTKVDMAASLDALRLTGSNLTGSYTRDRSASAPCTKLSGIAVASLQALAPKNTTIAANTIIFSGDVTGYLAVGKNVLIAKKFTSDGETIHKFLAKGDGNIAQLPVASRSYNSGTDETTLVLTNSELLDLDFDLTSASYNNNLRVIPFDYKFEAKTLTASVLEQLDIIDAFGQPEVRIPGQAAFLESINFTGTVLHHHIKFSPSGIYAFATIMEKASPNNIWKFYGSSNKGITWTLLGSKTADAGASAEEISFEFYRAHQNQVVVADNGKWFSVYPFYNGSNWDLKGIYGSLGLSDFNDTPAQSGGNPGGTVGTIGTGNVLVTGNHDNGYVCGDLTDLSMVAVWAKQEVAGVNGHIIYYSNGGATHFATNASTASTYAAGAPWGCYMTGTSGAHRAWFFYRQASDNGVRVFFTTEATENFQTKRDANNTASAESLLLGSSSLTDVFFHNNKLVPVYVDFSSNMYFRVISNAQTGTPSLGTQQQLSASGITVDGYMGGTDSSGGTEYAYALRHMNNRGYLNNDKLLYARDYTHFDGVRRTHVHEVRDITSYQGLHINQNSAPVNVSFRNTTTDTFQAQTFTATSSRVRTVSLTVQQVGTIPAGHTLWLEIQTTSAGLPTGTIVATSLNSYDPRNISKSASKQSIFFNFDTPSLTNGVVYALVLKSTFPISSSNYLQLPASNANPYAGGQFCNYNGTSWSAVSGYDYYFQVYGDWIYDLSHETRNESQEYNHQIWNQEATLAAIDSSTLRMAHRRTMNNTDVQRAKDGHVWTSLISLGSAGVASTYTVPAQIGYQSNAYDKNLVACIIPGIEDSSRIDRTLGRSTGISTTQKAEFSSGFSVATAITYGNIAADDFVSDSSFQYQTALDLATNEYIVYNIGSSSSAWTFNSAYPFAIEVEFKPSSLASIGNLISNYHNGLSHGWLLQVTTAGALSLSLRNSSNTTIGSVVSNNGVVTINTHYVLRITYDGNGSAPQMFLSTTGYNGTFNLLTPASSVPFSGTSGTTGGFRIGSAFAGSEVEFFNGKIGYVKIAKGSSSFIYDGAKPQHAMVGLINAGSKVFAETKKGNMDTTDMNQSYDEFGMIDPNGSSSSIVDSNDILLQFQQTLVNATGSDLQLKYTAGRASTVDISCLQGLNFRFAK